MTDPETGGAPSFPTLACKSILYRVILRSRSRDPDTGEPLPDLFLRRPGDHRGLSVNIAEHCTPADCVAPFARTYGIVTLHVGRIRDIRLDVEPDAPDHANIVGIPFPDDDPREAERFAGLLARQARLLREA
jgi:hypothetical protein